MIITYLYNMRCGRRRDEDSKRPAADIASIVVCVCNNYDGNPDAVAAAKESRSRFDFGRRAADRFSTIYLFIFFPTMYSSNTRHRFGADEHLFVYDLLYYYLLPALYNIELLYLCRYAYRCSTVADPRSSQVINLCVRLFYAFFIIILSTIMFSLKFVRHFSIITLLVNIFHQPTTS